MNERERFSETLLFGKPDKVPFMPGGPRESTLARWNAEGLPKGKDYFDAVVDELGIKYETLDLILYGLERFMTPEEVAEQLGIEKAIIEKVKSRWLANEHKRRMPLAPKIGYRTVGNDFRLPRHTY